jgi:hypothetical protein
MKQSLQEWQNKEKKVKKKNYLNIVPVLGILCSSENGKKIIRSDCNRKYINDIY